MKAPFDVKEELDPDLTLKICLQCLGFCSTKKMGCKYIYLCCLWEKGSGNTTETFPSVANAMWFKILTGPFNLKLDETMLDHASALAFVGVS